MDAVKEAIAFAIEHGDNCGIPDGYADAHGYPDVGWLSDWGAFMADHVIAELKVRGLAMGWEYENGERVSYSPEYRVLERDGGFEPQIQYQINGTEDWYALLETGYIADPNLWKIGSSGKSYVRVVLPTREMADRAILRAKTINQQNGLKIV